MLGKKEEEGCHVDLMQRFFSYLDIRVCLKEELERFLSDCCGAEQLHEFKSTSQDSGREFSNCNGYSLVGRLYFLCVLELGSSEI